MGSDRRRSFANHDCANDTLVSVPGEFLIKPEYLGGLDEDVFDEEVMEHSNKFMLCGDPKSAMVRLDNFFFSGIEI